MNRKEMYAFIKEHNDLAKAISDSENKNFTQCSNNLLKEYIEEYNLGISKDEEDVYTDNSDIDLVGIVGRLVEVLKNKRILVKQECDYILG